MKRIIFRYDDGSFKQAAIDQNKALGYRYDWMNFHNLDKRYVPGSTNMNFPPTAANKEIFGYFENAGIDLDFVRSGTIGIEMYFDAYQILKGRFNLREYSNGYSGFITSSSDIVDAINAKSITTILDNSTLTASFATIDIAMTYFQDISTDGWLIPITVANDDNTTTTPHYVDLQDQLGFNIAYNDIWRSTSKFIEDISSESGIDIYVYEAGGLVSFGSSNLFTTSRYHYFPVFRYAIEKGTGVTVDTIRGTATKKKGFDQSKKSYIRLDEFADIPVANTFDFIKLYSQYFNCGLYLDNELDRIVLVNYADLYASISSDLDWSAKLISYTKKPNITGYEKLNYINYAAVGNASAEDSRTLITNLDTYWLQETKDLYDLNLMNPPTQNLEGIRDDVLNTNHFDFSEWSNIPCFMKRGSLVTSFIRLDTLIATLGASSRIYRLEFDPIQSQYTWVDNFLAIGEEYKANLNLNIFDLTQLRPWSVVKIDRLGGLFHVNNIDSFDPYNNSKAVSSLIKIA